MSTLKNKRKLAAVSRETPENTEMAQQYISQVSEEIEGRVTDGVTYFGCFVQTRRVSSEPTSSNLFRSCSGNIQEQQLRKPGNHWGSFPKRSLSRSGVLFSSLWQSKWLRAGRDAITSTSAFPVRLLSLQFYKTLLKTMIGEYCTYQQIIHL